MKTIWYLILIASLVGLAVASLARTDGRAYESGQGFSGGQIFADLDMNGNDLLCDDSDASTDTKIVCDTDDVISMTINGTAGVYTFGETEFTAVASGNLYFGTLNSGNADFWTSNDAVRIKDPGTAPACEANVRGLVWNDNGAGGVADQLNICYKNAADAYSYLDLLSMSFTGGVLDTDLDFNGAADLICDADADTKAIFTGADDTITWNIAGSADMVWTNDNIALSSGTAAHIATDNLISFGPSLKLGASGAVGLAGNATQVKMVFGGSESYTWAAASMTGTQAAIGNTSQAATIPNWTFNGDTDTGLSSAANDACGLVAGAVEGLRVTEASSITTTEIFNAFEVPKVENATPAEIVACGATTTGSIVYIKDTDDGAAGELCSCMHTGDATYDWINITSGAACTYI